MNGSFTIRRAELEDAQTLVAFQEQMALETERRVLDRETVSAGVHHLLADGTDGFYVVACERARIVASLMITTEWSDWRNGLYWWIQSVYVIATHRRRGIYRGLYGWIKAEAMRNPRVCGFRLYVERENDVARTTYERLGMERTPYLLYEETRRAPETDGPATS